jgi:tRNA pseudouridine38-40 synthase
MRLAVGVEYDGGPFKGWQSQPACNTVQDTLESALSEIAGEKIKVTAAGRTDAGVHAFGQVAHFDTTASRPLQAWVRGTNSYLPSSIAVRWAIPVEAEFHARFSALARIYRYVLFNCPVRPALQHGRVGWYHRALDADLMQLAARFLRGEQDFSSFRSSECQAKSPVKNMYYALVTRHGDYVVFDFKATGFLHHMVRNIVGSLLEVGVGKSTPQWFSATLKARDRAMAGATFSSDGLYFVGAEYDPRWRLPETGRIISTFDPIHIE